MSFTYTLSTDIGRVRLKIADTVSTAYAFEDDEITQFLTDGSTVLGAAKLAMMALLASRALRIKRFSVGGQSYDDTAQVAAISAWLKMNGADLPSVASVQPATPAYDAGFTEPAITS